MRIITEDTLSNFTFWSGAVVNAEQLTYSELINLTDILEDMYPDGMTDTDINDLMWFEFDYVCELLGLTYDDETGDVVRDNEDTEEDTEGGQQ